MQRPGPEILLEDDIGTPSHTEHGFLLAIPTRPEPPSPHVLNNEGRANPGVLGSPGCATPVTSPHRMVAADSPSRFPNPDEPFFFWSSTSISRFPVHDICCMQLGGSITLRAREAKSCATDGMCVFAEDASSPDQGKGGRGDGHGAAVPQALGKPVTGRGPGDRNSPLAPVAVAGPPALCSRSRSCLLPIVRRI